MENIESVAMVRVVLERRLEGSAWYTILATIRSGLPCRLFTSFGSIDAKTRSLLFVLPRNDSEVVLSPSQDTFFRDHRYSNFGDLGMAIKSLVDEYQAKTKSNENIQSIGKCSGRYNRY